MSARVTSTKFYLLFHSFRLCYYLYKPYLFFGHHHVLILIWRWLLNAVSSVNEAARYTYQYCYLINFPYRIGQINGTELFFGLLNILITTGHGCMVINKFTVHTVYTRAVAKGLIALIPTIVY